MAFQGPEKWQNKIFEYVNNLLDDTREQQSEMAVSLF